MPEGLRLVVMGTTGFAVPSLERLLASGHEVLAVYTQPPRPKGRGQQVRRTPLHEAALARGLEVRTPRTLKDASEQTALAALEADLAVVGAYGLLLPKPVLTAPRLGCVNLHASLLPRWRGAAPIERAILAGDRETGVSIFQMEEGLDTGPVYAKRAVPIGPKATASELHGRLAELGAELLIEVLPGIAGGTLRPMPQPEEGVTYARKLERHEGRIDFKEPAWMIERRLRALNPAPGCWCEAQGQRLGLLAGEVVPGSGPPGTVLALPLVVACGEQALAFSRVQRAGRKPMTADELQHGFALPPGTKLA